MTKEVLEPRVVTDPFVPIQGTVTTTSLTVSVKHEPIVANHQQLDEAGGNYRPIFDRALRTGTPMKAGDFECSGDDVSFGLSGGLTWCGNCLLEVSDESAEKTS